MFKTFLSPFQFSFLLQCFYCENVFKKSESRKTNTVKLHVQYHLASMVCQLVPLGNRFWDGVRTAKILLVSETHRIKWGEARLGRGSHQTVMQLCQFVSVQQGNPGPRLPLEESYVGRNGWNLLPVLVIGWGHPKKTVMFSVPEGINS